jgi:DNA-directed RNA polymerase subunit H (RpoH/RPB5)
MSDSESIEEYSNEFLSSEEDQEYEKKQNDIVDPRVKQTVKEMLNARGYTITQEIQEDEVKSLIGSKENYPNLHVLFATDYAGGEEVKFNIKIVNFYLLYIDKLKLQHVIIIHQGKITSLVNSAIKNYMIVKKAKIEIFQQCTLKFNITKHRLQPIFKVMSKTESENFKKKYGNLFNKMFLTDPIARFYGYEKGDVVIVYRKDRPVNYRIVI